MRQEDKTCFVRDGVEIAREAYKTGFDDGFEAAVYTFITLSDSMEARDGVGIPDGIIEALGKCGTEAFECFGRDRFEVRHLPTVGSEQ